MRASVAVVLTCLLAIASAAINPRVNIGMSVGSNEIVSNGVVQPSFRVNSPSQYIFQTYFAWQEMFISLSSGADQEYYASCSNPNHAMLTCSLDQSTDSGLVTTKRQHVLRVSTLCASQPGDVVTVSIALTAFDNITIQYYKQCQVNTPRIGLSVSTNDWFAGGPPANVAIDGMVMDQWLDDQTGPNQSYDESVQSLTFYMWVSNGTQPYVVVSSSADNTIMNPVVTGGQGLVRVPSFGSGQRAAITVNFNCINEGPGGFGWVSIAIDIDPFNPITFAWFKKCPAPPSGWTGFGIFCFVVFILTLVACIGGCIFKYVKLHARGVEIVPFIDTYRNVYARFKGTESTPYQGVVFQSGVGPQAQFDAPMSESSSLAQSSTGSNSNPFGSSYQSSV
jgi:hypothetical protein